MEQIRKNFPFFVTAKANFNASQVIWLTGATGRAEMSEHRCQLARQKRLASFLSDVSHEEESATPWIVTFVIMEEDGGNGFHLRMSFLTSAFTSQAVPATDQDIFAAGGREEDGSHGADDVIIGEAPGGRPGDESSGSLANEEKATVWISSRMPHGMHDLGDQYDNFDDFYGCYSW